MVNGVTILLIVIWALLLAIPRTTGANPSGCLAACCHLRQLHTTKADTIEKIAEHRSFTYGQFRL
ncbi:hypothetical protein ACLB1E_27050 [Escherichia coli]